MVDTNKKIRVAQFQHLVILRSPDRKDFVILTRSEIRKNGLYNAVVEKLEYDRSIGSDLLADMAERIANAMRETGSKDLKIKF